MNVFYAVLGILGVLGAGIVGAALWAYFRDRTVFQWREIERDAEAIRRDVEARSERDHADAVGEIMRDTRLDHDTRAELLRRHIRSDIDRAGRNR